MECYDVDNGLYRLVLVLVALMIANNLSYETHVLAWIIPVSIYCFACSIKRTVALPSLPNIVEGRRNQWIAWGITFFDVIPFSMSTYILKEVPIPFAFPLLIGILLFSLRLVHARLEFARAWNVTTIFSQPNRDLR